VNKMLPPAVVESSEISELIGITSAYLNKFVEREMYGIKPSVKTGKGRGKRRLFSSDDVSGIALVWWLFESGLRSGSIQYVLNQICGRRLHSKANDAATVLLEKEVKMLAIYRKPRSAKEIYRKYPSQSVEFLDEFSALKFIMDKGTVSTLIVPVGDFYSHLKRKMQAQ
jgi:hypothetical protein